MELKFTEESMSKELREFLIDELLIDMEPDEISADASLGNEIGVDSLGFTELMAHIEDTYKIKISDEEFTPENFRTINNIIKLIQNKL
ncbi:acyl carrier protein [Anaeromicropila populeti]|uniref:Acyl carrier protein n=1 Tax=Anaeromicropila populeti TaxID=37658 RepID=A0A1I6HSA4_9FIRM|nr:acyl carrier protein [Anaeromicropila populeti]SFR57361.1 acyl carrier protein [Anaeromicropila populeti]